MGRHGFEYHAARANFGTLADGDIAEYGGVCANQHAVCNLGMAVAAFFPCAAEGYPRNASSSRWASRLVCSDSWREVIVSVTPASWLLDSSAARRVISY